ncbi:uncharacterized protein [Nicotiana tomentosiformis]|uniref:uncharacterized protein n=1 Tax=Nicotiana tomentosiformis TaxID=4098 RepID=UPI00388C924F
MRHGDAKQVAVGEDGVLQIQGRICVPNVDGLRELILEEAHSFSFNMSKLSKLEFVALDITGKNYLSWVLDAEIHLDAKGFENTIIQENEASNQDIAKAMIFLRHHLHEGLKTEYLTVKDPLELWINLKDRYDHLKLTQYSEKVFKKYSELITCLLAAEQNNALLIKNHETRPTGSTLFPEVNVVAAYDKSERKRNNYRGRGHSRRRGRGRNNYRHYGRNKQENNKGS